MVAVQWFDQDRDPLWGRHCTGVGQVFHEDLVRIRPRRKPCHDMDVRGADDDGIGNCLVNRRARLNLAAGDSRQSIITCTNITATGI